MAKKLTLNDGLTLAAKVLGIAASVVVLLDWRKKREDEKDPVATAADIMTGKR